MDVPIESGCTRVLRHYGFDGADCDRITTRAHLPGPGKLAKRLISLRNGLGVRARPRELHRIVRTWPEILQYRSTRIAMRIDDLAVWMRCGIGQATTMLRTHPSILGLDTLRIIHTAQILTHLGLEPSGYPNAFLLNPELIRGRCMVLVQRGDREISASGLFQAGHGPFEGRTRCNVARVRSEDPGQWVFLQTSFALTLHVRP